MKINLKQQLKEIKTILKANQKKDLKWKKDLEYLKRAMQKALKKR